MGMGLGGAFVNSYMKIRVRHEISFSFTLPCHARTPVKPARVPALTLALDHGRRGQGWAKSGPPVLERGSPMCGRFVQTPIRDAASLGFPQLVGDLLSMPASYNLAPTQRAAVVLDRGEGLQLQRLAWGLLPFWAKEKKLQGSTINARIETVATKPAFRSAFKKHRCLIPMAGYYE